MDLYCVLCTLVSNEGAPRAIMARPRLYRCGALNSAEFPRFEQLTHEFSDIARDFMTVMPLARMLHF
jgi:hypothetical protein